MSQFKELDSINVFELRVLIKLLSAQAIIMESLDGVYLQGLKERLQRGLQERGRGQGILDMSQSSHGQSGNFDFKLIYNTSHRVTTIKLIREVMGIGLKEAKDIADIGLDPNLPEGAVVFMNSTEELYNKFVANHALLRGHGWDSEYTGDRLRELIQIVPISTPSITAAPPAGSD